MVWHSCIVQDFRKIEKIEYRALRHVYNYFTARYTILRGKGKRSLMYVQRLGQMVIEVYKVCHNIGPVYMREKETSYSCMSNV